MHVEPVSVRKVSKEVTYLTDIIITRFQELMTIKEEGRNKGRNKGRTKGNRGKYLLRLVPVLEFE